MIISGNVCDISGETVPEVPGDEGTDTPSVPDRTTALCRGLNLVLKHHGCRLFVRREIIEQIESFLNSSFSEEVWLKRSKYLLAFPNAKYLKNDLPTPPDVPFRFSGCARRWVKNRLNAFCRKNSHLWYSWFQGKRCSLPASDDFVEKTYEEHFISLTKEDPGNEFAIDAMFSDPTFFKVLKKVRRSIDNDLNGRIDSLIDVSLTSSSSACFENPRKFGGQLGELRTITGLDVHRDRRGRYSPRKIKIKDNEKNKIVLGDGTVVEKPNPQCSRLSDHFCSCGSLVYERPDGLRVFAKGGGLCAEQQDWDEFQKLASGLLWSTSHFKSFSGFYSDLYMMIESPTLYSAGRTYFNHVTEVRMPYGYEEWDDLRHLSRCLDLSRPCSCTIQAVLEPFKVRVISKGNALDYYSCRPLQRSLWGAIKEIPCFRLVGRPFLPSDILDLREKSLPDWEWFSIDYSAATDGLSWKFTSRILRFLLANQPRRVLDLALRVLGPHNLFYPSRNECGGPQGIFRGLQRNGQLMGSILSFPLLCLANLATYLVTMRLEQQDWSYLEILNHVLVNGDDMVYSGPVDLWTRHVRVASDIGLQMSQGKAYHHRTYLNINSTAVHCNLGIKDLPYEIPYLNCGLYFGLHKVQRSDTANDNHSGDKGLFANANTLVRGSLPGKEIEVLKHYLSLHQKEMTEQSSAKLLLPEGGVRSFCRNWFLPISCGGMGIIPPKGWRFLIRPIDRRVVKNLLNEGVPSKATQRPLPGYEVKELSSEAIVPWKKREVVWSDGEMVQFEEVTSFRVPINSRARKSRCHLPILTFSRNQTTSFSRVVKDRVSLGKRYCPNYRELPLGVAGPLSYNPLDWENLPWTTDELVSELEGSEGCLDSSQELFRMIFPEFPLERLSNFF